MSKKMSVSNSIKALALINIQDIFRFMITAHDNEIEERYGTEEDGIMVAEKYLEIALKATLLESPLHGWSMTYSQPIKNSDDRREYKAYFYDKEDGEQENT